MEWTLGTDNIETVEEESERDDKAKVDKSTWGKRRWKDEHQQRMTGFYQPKRLENEYGNNGIYVSDARRTCFICGKKIRDVCDTCGVFLHTLDEAETLRCYEIFHTQKYLENYVKKRKPEEV